MNDIKKENVVGNFFVLLAEKTDGKKTMGSLILLAGGIATMLITPEHDESGISMISAGLVGLIVGVTHKAVKKKGADGRHFV